MPLRPYDTLIASDGMIECIKQDSKQCRATCHETADRYIIQFTQMHLFFNLRRRNSPERHV